MSAIIAVIFSYLPYLVQAAASIPQITTLLAELQAIFARTNVWTPAQEAEFDAQTTAMRDDPYWKVSD